MIIIKIFMMIGAVSALLILEILLIALVVYLAKKIYKSNQKRKYKKRWGRLPMITCYCIDCEYCNGDYTYGECCHRTDFIASNGFCEQAKLREITYSAEDD